MEFSSHRVAQLSNGGDGVAVVSSNGEMFELSKHRMVEWLNGGVSVVVGASIDAMVKWWSWRNCRIVER